MLKLHGEYVLTKAPLNAFKFKMKISVIGFYKLSSPWLYTVAIATSTNMASATGGGWLKSWKHTRQQLDTVVGTNSCFVKFLCVGVCVGYCLSFSDRAMFSLCILPGNVLPPNFWIWTCLTHNFVEVCSTCRVDCVYNLSTTFDYSICIQWMCESDYKMWKLVLQTANVLRKSRVKFRASIFVLCKVSM